MGKEDKTIKSQDIENKVCVRHSVGTHDDKAPSGETWIDYWCNKTHRKIPEICPSCDEPPTQKYPMVGAHVELFIDLPYISKNKQHYITPTCKKCNTTYKASKQFHSFLVDKDDLLELNY